MPEMKTYVSRRMHCEALSKLGQTLYVKVQHNYCNNHSCQTFTDKISTTTRAEPVDAVPWVYSSSASSLERDLKAKTLLYSGTNTTQSCSFLGALFFHEAHLFNLTETVSS